jgi:2-hydroxychromene-2-carboxylate isomerase
MWLPAQARKASLDQTSGALEKSRIMPVTIDYYLTINSPWVYLGSAPFAEVARRHGAVVNVKPCKFGPIFDQTGGLPR